MEKQQKQYPQMGIRVSAELMDKLADKAKQEQRSVSQVVRMAVEKYLNQQ